MYKPKTTWVNGIHPLGSNFKENDSNLQLSQMKRVVFYIRENGPITASDVIKNLGLLETSARSQIRAAKSNGVIAGVWGKHKNGFNRVIYYSGN